METRAFVLVETASDRCGQVLTALRQLKRVISADAVTSPYDIIVIAHGETPDDISELIDGNIHHIDGVTRTVTCVTI